MTSRERYFDSVALEYSKRSRGFLWKRVRESESAVMMGMLDGHPLGDVLELGCGSGYYSKLLYERKCDRLVCVDLSSKMLENLDTPGCEKIEADIQYFQSESRFDTIVCAGVMEFLQKPDNIFNNVAAMLNPQGLFVILIPLKSLAGKMYRLFHRTHGIHLTLFNLDEIEKWANVAGLETTSHQRVSMFSLVVGFRLKRERVK